MATEVIATLTPEALAELRHRRSALAVAESEANEAKAEFDLERARFHTLVLKLLHESGAMPGDNIDQDTGEITSASKKTAASPAAASPTPPRSA